MKEKSTIYRSDVVETFDRCKMAFYDLTDFCTRTQSTILIKVEKDGTIYLQSTEETKDYIYQKDITKANKKVEYHESQLTK